VPCDHDGFAAVGDPVDESGSFRWLWIACASGAMADGIAATALPLLFVNLTHDPVTVSLLQVALGLPWLLLGLHAGVLSDPSISGERA
jgi:hypothetical protein